MNVFTLRKHSSLLGMLITLTVLAIIAQISLFYIHYRMSTLIDSLVHSSISTQITYPIFLLPILGFITLQLIAYSLIVAFIWFAAVSIGQLWQLGERAKLWLGILIWFIACAGVVCFNNYNYPTSFFAFALPYNTAILIVSSIAFSLVICLAYFNYFKNKRHRFLGTLFLGIAFVMIATMLHDRFYWYAEKQAPQNTAKPNIIFIGLDSLRPDFTGYFGPQKINTPNINQFLQSGTTFREAYTPLARTFPAWVSILSAKHPRHNAARNNLANPADVAKNDTFAKHLQQAGYETIYATDEKRFSNITKDFGFDNVIGPSMGLNDFLIGGLSDFPLTNLLVNLPVGRFLFPYNYANRAAAVTYEPDKFLNLVQLALAKRSAKPLFLTVHFCLSHWPYTWAHDGQKSNLILPAQYASSVEAVDAQLGKLLSLLKREGLLENTLVVLLSDHGTGLGMIGDRATTEKNFRGDAANIKFLSVSRFSTAPFYSFDFKRDYSINTAYGQGTDVLSLKQVRVLLSYKGFGITIPQQTIEQRGLLIDIAPTVLDFLHLPPIAQADGMSMAPLFAEQANKIDFTRPIFWETGDKFAAIETDKIAVDKVIKQRIGSYEINRQTGLLYLNDLAEKSLVKSKQRAVLWGDWILALYPQEVKTKMVTSEKTKQMVRKSYTADPFYVLYNIKTGLWTINFASPLAKTAPVDELKAKLFAFYGDEM